MLTPVLHSHGRRPGRIRRWWHTIPADVRQAAVLVTVIAVLDAIVLVLLVSGLGVVE